LNEPGVQSDFGKSKLLEAGEPHLFKSVGWSDAMRQRRAMDGLDIRAPLSCIAASMG
jgi:hypothetical protein